MQAIVQQVVQHSLPSLFGQHELASVCLLRADVLLSEVISVERVELALQLFVDVGVLAVGVADEDRFAEVRLQRVDLLDLVADLAVAQTAEEAFLEVCHDLLAGGALLCLTLEIPQIVRWSDEASHHNVSVRLGRLDGDLKRRLFLLQIRDDLLHDHEDIDWQIRMRLFLIPMRVEGRELLADVLIESKKQLVALQRNWFGDGDVLEGFRGEEEQVEQKFGDGQLAPLEVLRIEDRIEGDLVDECLEEQRKDCLYVLQFELDQLCPVLIEEGVYASEVLKKGDDSV